MAVFGRGLAVFQEIFLPAKHGRFCEILADFQKINLVTLRFS